MYDPLLLMSSAYFHTRTHEVIKLHQFIFHQKTSKKFSEYMKILFKVRWQWRFYCNFFSSCTNFRPELDDEIFSPDNIGTNHVKL